MMEAAMKNARRVALVAVACLISAAASAQVATQKRDMGKIEFESNCASCHGSGGKGNGPVTDLLKKSPPDLTLLAQRNGGVLPVARLYEIIEGSSVSGHGTREMPVWGREYRIIAGEYYMDYPYDPEVFVRGKILALVDYINRIQAR
jgi:mono/diheme cytochrome c family protein